MISATQFQARLGMALGALAIRYLDLVAEGRNADAGAVRRAFSTVYLSRGGRAALRSFGQPTSLPTTLSSSGWSENLAAAMAASIVVMAPSALPSLQGMPTAFNALGAWWRSVGADVQSRFQLTALEVLMELEAVPAQEGPLLAAVDLFIAGPMPEIRDPWVEQPGGLSADGSPSLTTVTPVDQPVRTSTDVFTVLGRTNTPKRPVSVSWPWVIAGLGLAVGLGYGGYLVYRDNQKRKLRRRIGPGAADQRRV